MVLGFSINSIFKLVVGTALMIVGIGGIIQHKKYEKPRIYGKGKVLYSKHIEKKDEQGYYKQFYYDVCVEIEEKGRKKKYNINCMDQYKAGDEVEIITNPNGNGELKIFTPTRTPVLGQWVMTVIGAFLFLTPAAKVKFGQKYLSALASPVCIVAGAALIIVYFKENRRKLEKIDAEIIGLLKWQKVTVGKDGKQHKSGTALYCPILRYEKEGVERIRRSRGNSNVADVYPIGGKLPLYKDLETGYYTEEKPKSAMVVMGLILIIFGVIGVITILL